MIEPIEGERQCSACSQCKPLSGFRFQTHKMRYARQCRQCESDASMARQKRREGRPWTDAEIQTIQMHYPDGGSYGCKAYLPDRKKSEIQAKAWRMGVEYLGQRISGSPPKEDAWAVPSHTYGPEDVAMRAWGAPANDAPLRWCA